MVITGLPVLPPSSGRTRTRCPCIPGEDTPLIGPAAAYPIHLKYQFTTNIKLQNESLEIVLTWWLFHVLIYNLFSIEENIASRELYPIHALDDQEFFPGDFVVRTSINSDLGQVTSFKIYRIGSIKAQVLIITPPPQKSC